MTKIYGYARCSTNDTKQDVSRQEKELLEMGASKETIFTEYASGAKVDRIELNRLLDALEPGDTIVCLEVSRITRSTKQLCELIALIQERQLKLVIKDSLTIDCTGGNGIDPMSKAFITIAGVFAELERDMTTERIKSGMKNAKAKGAKMGRPKTTAEDVPALFYKHYPKFKSGQINKRELGRLSNISYPSVYKYLEIVEAGN